MIGSRVYVHIMHRTVNPISSIAFPGHLISHTRRIMSLNLKKKLRPEHCFLWRYWRKKMFQAFHPCTRWSQIGPKWPQVGGIQSSFCLGKPHFQWSVCTAACPENNKKRKWVNFSLSFFRVSYYFGFGLTRRFGLGYFFSSRHFLFIKHTWWKPCPIVTQCSNIST